MQEAKFREFNFNITIVFYLERNAYKCMFFFVIYRKQLVFCQMNSFYFFRIFLTNTTITSPINNYSKSYLRNQNGWKKRKTNSRDFLLYMVLLKGRILLERQQGTCNRILRRCQQKIFCSIDRMQLFD